ncbi:MAG TPA: LD-carboxypeptidase [Paludibacter sp.]|nr:LD-carboxypeptidase [Paludibacter sp.]
MTRMFPPFLNSGDQIRIVSPSGVIDPQFIDGASNVLAEWGLQVTEGTFARTEYGRFGGTQEQRVADLQQALDDPNVKAILCSRGGYGLAQIVDKLDFSRFQQLPKWMIGFSDITILHNAITNLGIASVHSIMAKHLTELAAGSEQSQGLKDLLFGKLPHYEIPAEPLNRAGEAHGKLIGGNLSVIMGLRGSQFDLPYKNNILFIEDIAEKPYHIDRMMQNLRFSGALSQLSGLVVGQFSDCEEDPLMKQTIAEIIYDAVCCYDYPVCFNFPAGHVDYNLPLVLGADVCLDIASNTSRLTF